MSLTVYEGRPADKRSDREEACYDILDSLAIPYLRVDHPEAGSMEELAPVEEALGASMCKNVIVCNRQKTSYYLLCMPGDKPFVTKEFSAALGIARVSFADAGALMELLGLTPGSVSVSGLACDKEGRVALYIDSDLKANERFLFHPNINTSSVSISTKDLFDKLLPALGHAPGFIELAGNKG